MKTLELSESFRATVRRYPKEVRGKIGKALEGMQNDFGHPHRHRGLGVRKLSPTWFEIRVGLDIRLIFQNRLESLLFVMAGNHDEVRKFLRGR